MTAGVPGSGLLPGLVDIASVGTALGGSDDRMQAFNFRVIMTRDAARKVAMPVPAAFDPAEYELFFRLVDSYNATGGTFDVDWSFNGNFILPNSFGQQRL